jgi:hypothetical protein
VRFSAAASLAGLLLLLAGCGGSSPKKNEPGPPKVREQLPPFRGRPVRVKVSPRRGHRLTTFRIRFRPREFVGVRARARISYQASLFDRTNPNGLGCIVDTGGPAVPIHGRLEVTLDPRRQKGGIWCRGRFSGALTYYRGFACPDVGVCRPPKDFPRRSRNVARLAFVVR